jgi:serine/threonine-protein phosphatase 2A regulatory subunit B'
LAAKNAENAPSSVQITPHFVKSRPMDVDMTSKQTNEPEDMMDEDTRSPNEMEEDDGLNKELVIMTNKQQFEERPQPSRFRRKSVLPVDADVMSELSRHKSLEDLIASKEAQRQAESSS